MSHADISEETWYLFQVIGSFKERWYLFQVIGCVRILFYICGIDLFRPFSTKESRKELKGYGALFTWFSSGAIHIKTVASLNKIHSFCVYADLLVAWGNIRLLRSDHGCNFVGVSSEFGKAFAEMDQQRIMIS